MRSRESQASLLAYDRDAEIVQDIAYTMRSRVKRGNLFPHFRDAEIVQEGDIKPLGFVACRYASIVCFSKRHMAYTMRRREPMASLLAYDLDSELMQDIA